MSIKEAGAELGLGRSAAYEAARRGELPTIRLGRRMVVSTARLRKLVGLDDYGQPEWPAPPHPGPGSPATVLPFGRGRRLGTSP